MTRPPDERKDMGTLKHEDFQVHPIWAGYEDDYGGSWVEPVASLEIVDEDDFDMFFVYCGLQLADGTSLKGVVYISSTSRFVYGIEFYHGEYEFHFPGVGLRDRAIEHLELWLGKDLSEVSPVTYSTPFHWGDGAAVAGTIDLVEWNRRRLQT